MKTLPRDGSLLTFEDCIDDVSYKIRFTPRKRRSIWSAVNIKRAQELIDQRLIQPAGLKAFNLLRYNSISPHN